MPISTQIKIEIAGENLARFSRLVINQKVQSHHKFSLLQPLPKEFVNQAVEKAQTYVGKAIKISITPSSMMTDSPLVFNGIITETQLVRTSGASGGIIINGFSPTILLEGVPTLKSFSDQTLGAIVSEVLQSYSSEDLKPTVDIQKDNPLSYTVQYGESDFGFLCRLAQKKGQWFYYNGEELLFGKPKSKDFTLEYGRLLHSFNIEMRAKPIGFEYLGYDPSNGETQKANSGEVNFEPQGYAKIMYESSKKMFPNTSTILYSQALEEGNSKTHLADRLTMQLQSRTADLVTAKGESDETGLRIGDVVSIKEPSFSLTGNSLDGLQEQSFGNYIITDLMHVCDESGTYHNTFEAVPESVLSPPYGNVHSFPIAETQPATIISNNDPAGLGRVQVAFAWQKDSGKHTPWIRLTNPHSGGGKGFYFVPEVDEEVLVAFEGGNAEKPFVLGAMYNGSAGSNYSTSGNDKKVIQTRSGANIIMDDAAGSISFADQGTANMLFDGAGNVSTKSKSTHSVNVGESEECVLKMDSAGNITLDGKTSLTITIGESKLEMKADGSILLNGKNLQIVGSTKTEVGKAGGNAGMVIDTNVTIKGTDVNIN